MHCRSSLISALVLLTATSSAALAQVKEKKAAVPAAAAPEKFIIEALPDRLARRVDSQREMLLQFGLADPGKTPKGVINALKIWTADYPVIRVCFVSGSRQIRTRITRIAMEWRTAVPGLPLDFGELSNPRRCAANEVNHIRVTFRDSGYWSLVGTDSIRLAGQQEPSMNLEDFDTSPPNAGEFQATVLHEFGHAIGLEHEHQSPLAKCRDEFDWPRIYSWLAGPPNNWSKDIVDFNMRVLHQQGLLATKFDKQSIMLYTFPASYFKNGSSSTCYSDINAKLSVGDKEIVATLYPESRSARIAIVNRIREHHLAMIKALGQAEGAKSGVLQLIDEVLPARTDRSAPKK
jgi:hypothetical protein